MTGVPRPRVGADEPMVSVDEPVVAAAGGPLLAVRDLSVRFASDHGEIEAVDAASFDVREGEILGLVGESGSGKTVTATAILRLIRKPGRQTGGSILFDGRDLSHLPEDELQQIRGAISVLRARGVEQRAGREEELDERLRRGAERRMVDHGGERPQDAVAPQPVDPALDRRGRERDAAGDVVVGPPAVLDEKRKDPAIKVVHTADSCRSTPEIGPERRSQ